MFVPSALHLAASLLWVVGAASVTSGNIYLYYKFRVFETAYVGDAFIA